VCLHDSLEGERAWADDPSLWHALPLSHTCLWHAGPLTNRTTVGSRSLSHYRRFTPPLSLPPLSLPPLSLPQVHLADGSVAVLRQTDLHHRARQPNRGLLTLRSLSVCLGHCVSLSGDTRRTFTQIIECELYRINVHSHTNGYLHTIAAR
jgi:hypothetical protein